jgi:hypothetical protein
MICRRSADEHWSFRCLLAASLICASAAIGVGQPPPPYTASSAVGGASSGTLIRSATILPPPAPGQVAAQSSAYSQTLPVPQNTGALRDPAQPISTSPPPGYRPLSPPPPTWRSGQYDPLPPPVEPISVPVRPALPDMVYQVTSRFWLRPEALVWNTKAAPVPQPIVTTGSPTDTVPGALGQPGTQVAFGGGNASFGYVGGIRLESGVWLDARRIFGAEAGYFALIQQSRQFTDGPDVFSTSVIARPVIDAQSGTERAYVDSLIGQVIGGANVVLRSEFQGANIDGVLNLIQTRCLRLDGLLGFRYLSLSESLNISDQLTAQPGGLRTFAGAPINLADTLADFDGFHVTNSFYGGSGGARLYFLHERWLFTALGKVAYGQVQQRAMISGSTTFTDQQGVQTTLPGGILATNGNIGSHYQSRSAVAPEAHLNIGYQITPMITFRIGYSFLYLSNVARPGNQVTRVTNPNQIPSDPAFGGPGPTLPAFQFHTTSYWAQGINFGFDARF